MAKSKVRSNAELDSLKEDTLRLEYQDLRARYFRERDELQKELHNAHVANQRIHDYYRESDRRFIYCLTVLNALLNTIIFAKVWLV